MQYARLVKGGSKFVLARVFLSVLEYVQKARSIDPVGLRLSVRNDHVEKMVGRDFFES
jgi:hypothetical protein